MKIHVARLISQESNKFVLTENVAHWKSKDPLWHLGTWSVGMEVMGWWLDLMILEVFSNFSAGQNHGIIEHVTGVAYSSISRHRRQVFNHSGVKKYLETFLIQTIIN